VLGYAPDWSCEAANLRANQYSSTSTLCRGCAHGAAGGKAERLDLIWPDQPTLSEGSEETMTFDAPLLGAGPQRTTCEATIRKLGPRLLPLADAQADALVHAPHILHLIFRDIVMLVRELLVDEVAVVSLDTPNVVGLVGDGRSDYLP